MRIYVASSWRNATQPEVVRRLQEAGHEVYDFRHPTPGDHGFAWSDVDPTGEPRTARALLAALGHPVACIGFESDMRALADCDACVLVLPCGRSAHLEAGWAAGAGKLLIILLAEENEPELMYRMAVPALTLEDVVAALAVAAPTPQGKASP